MNLKKILIASVLKSVDDVRHYGKIAKSLETANKYQIFILGKGYEKKSPFSNISFCNTGLFKRISLRRIQVQMLFARKIIRLKPALVIITTIELLPIACLIKTMIPFKLIYDVQEDYLSNIKNQTEYGRLQKLVLLPTITIIQKLFHQYVDQFLLAEATYLKDIKGVASNSTVLENKVEVNDGKIDIKKWHKNKTLKLLFSGSLSEYSGVKNALHIYKLLKNKHNNTVLTIIGAYHDSTLAKHLIEQKEKDSSIELFIDNTPIDHPRIIDEIKRSHLGIIGYKPNPTNCQKTPTKLYEYAGFGLPYLISANPHWITTSSYLGGGIVVNFESIDAASLLNQLQNITEWDCTRSHWSSENDQIKELINSLMY